jgi:hypothetical protein
MSIQSRSIGERTHDETGRLQMLALEKSKTQTTPLLVALQSLNCHSIEEIIQKRPFSHAITRKHMSLPQELRLFKVYTMSRRSSESRNPPYLFIIFHLPTFKNTRDHSVAKICLTHELSDGPKNDIALS